MHRHWMVAISDGLEQYDCDIFASSPLFMITVLCSVLPGYLLVCDFDVHLWIARIKPIRRRYSRLAMTKD